MQWFWLGLAAGVVAVYLAAESIAELRSNKEYQSLAIRLAEFLWLLGNLVWLLNDIITGDEALLGRGMALVLFIVSICCGVAGLVCKDEKESQETEHLLADLREGRTAS